MRLVQSAGEGRCRAAHLVDEAAHARAGRQHDEDAGKQHQVTLLFVLHETRTTSLHFISVLRANAILTP